MCANRKVILSIWVVAILVFGAMSVGLEKTFTDIEGNEHEDAILEMTRLGILDGVGNQKFAPNGELNRAAAAKVAAYLLGYTQADADLAAKERSSFSDVTVDHYGWALGWINLMSEQGVLKGVGGGRYAPEDPLQMVHWATILTRILDHEQAGMSWPDDYNQSADDLGLIRGLYYDSTRVMNRSEMARMTTTALYLVQRPDGKKIIDEVVFKEKPLEAWDVKENVQPMVYDDASIQLELSDSLLAIGGGQALTITVKATHGEDQKPAANTQIEFFASTGPSDRRGQLSSPMAITNSQGIAKATYITLPEDDGQLLEFLVNIQTNDDWLERRASALVSNTGAFINGRVINPFTGQAPQESSININAANKPNISVSIDEDGYYSSPVAEGTYYVNFNMNVGSSFPHAGPYRGSHFEINAMGDLRYSFQQSFSPGNQYTLNSEMGVVSGTSQLTSGTDIYITAVGTQDTKIATIADNGRFMITLSPGTYEIQNNVGTVLKGNILIKEGQVTDIGGL